MAFTGRRGGGSKTVDGIRAVATINLSFEGLEGEGKEIARKLNRQIKSGFRALAGEKADLKKAVYVFRTTGPIVVAYEKLNSPILYVGSGDVTTRVATHVRTWVTQLRGVGQGVGIEVRYLRAKKRNNAEYYKHVEADLIAVARDKLGSVPFLNSRYEKKFEGEYDYALETRKLLRRLIGIGSGKRPLWAISPTPANKAYGKYIRGWA